MRHITLSDNEKKDGFTLTVTREDKTEAYYSFYYRDIMMYEAIEQVKNIESEIIIRKRMEAENIKVVA